jgi:hypothetical protein
MCDKKIMVLKQQLIKPAKGIRTIIPEVVKSLQLAPQCITTRRILKKADTISKVNFI